MAICFRYISLLARKWMTGLLNVLKGLMSNIVENHHFKLLATVSFHIYELHRGFSTLSNLFVYSLG